MDTHQNISDGTNAWQASFSTLQMHYKNELLAARNTSGLSHQPVPRKLTTEAYIMLCTILLFAILTVSKKLLTSFASSLMRREHSIFLQKTSN
ncbi:hypothetical protein HNY73_014065 [Argiope bruennichi]|uniref:Uncharacterized protein n=1 Tax=Argiope bruennichi TaxID=94029 RepID=A0A8T0ENW4_ARGBR|nr:hypothetical protein HNY73_014065 [Argiope bruennichi]